MHRKIAVVVSALLFALLAVAVTLVATMHDRSYPQQLSTKAIVNLDFSSAELDDAQAIRELGELSDRLDAGLVKVAPNLGGDQTGQVFVKVGTEGAFPERIQRFGNDQDAQVRGKESLEHSYASGEYLVTGSTSGLPAFKDWLTSHRVITEWSDNNLGGTLKLVLKQGSFVTSLLAATALMVSLVLYWLSVKARGRALRALAGVSTWRIQYEDLAGFLVAVLTGALAVDLLAVVWTGFTQGWTFAPKYLSILLTFDVIVILATMGFAVAMSAASWPGPAMLARREPAVKSLRKVSVALKVLTFVLVLAAVAPAVTAYSNARGSAEQQARWKSLADQVVVSIPAALGEDGFQQIMGQVGAAVGDAEKKDAVALSYSWQDEALEGVDLGKYETMALVSPSWLRLMNKDAPGDLPGLTALPPDQLPAGAKEFAGANLDLWTRDKSTGAAALSKVSFYHLSQPGKLPLAGGGSGDLVFPKDAIVMVAPHLHSTFNDDFLASVATTRNLVFKGLGETQALLTKHGLQYKTTVKYAAEEGVLLAQFTAYFAWLQGVSLIALVIALVVSSLIAAFITAVLRSKHDFPLRLAGQQWREILAARVITEWIVGAGLAVMIILLRRGDGALLVAAAAVLGLLAAPVTHLLATRWTFANVSRRRL
ncbi:hypothetical protein [Kribbella catacumbae]|uniref:hypothetical protein n=1 Tax=Kribbella catacumbae TaxID=460086 RepID=UPI0004783A64|nr:hypothetical protein [Kribbella catacumbae]